MKNPDIILKGFAIGNGAISLSIMNEHYADFAYLPENRKYTKVSEKDNEKYT